MKKKYNIIIHSRQIPVKLFLRHTRIKNHHHGVDYLRSKVRERCSILKLQSSLCSTESNIFTCRMYCTVTNQHIVTDLPLERIAYKYPPFTNTQLANFLLMCLGPTKSVGVSSSHAYLIVPCMLKLFTWTPVHMSWEQTSLSPVKRGTLAFIGQTLVLLFWRGKNYARITKSRLLSVLQQNLPIKAIRGGSTLNRISTKRTPVNACERQPFLPRNDNT